MTFKKEILEFLKILPDHQNFSERIQRTLYYGMTHSSDKPSFPITGLLVKKFNSFCNKRKLDKLDLHAASSICYDSCVTPCSIIISLLYLDRLRRKNPEYLKHASPSQVFIVTMMVASKYLYDDGEEDEVYNDEWATSGAMFTLDLNRAEKEFLSAIDWNLYVDLKSFMDALVYAEVEVAKQESLGRGFFTYTDLNVVSQVLPPIWSSLISVLSSALAVCLLGYAATIIGVTSGSLVAIRCSSYLTHDSSTSGYEVDLSKDTMQDNDTDELEVKAEICEEELLNMTGSDNLNDADIPPNCEENKNYTPFLPTTPARFSTLRTLTAALLLASSASGLDPSFNHYGHCPRSHNGFATFSDLNNDLPLMSSENYNSHPEYFAGTRCWNRGQNADFLSPRPSLDVFPLSNMSYPQTEFNYGFQDNSTGDRLKETPPIATSQDNLTKVIFRPEFASLTTGNYILPSSKDFHLINEDNPDIVSNFYYLVRTYLKHEDEYTLASNLEHGNWMENVMTYLQWKSLPNPIVFGKLSFKHFESSLSPIFLPT